MERLVSSGGGGGVGEGAGSSPSSRAFLPRGVSLTISPSLKEPRSCPSDRDDREALKHCREGKILKKRRENERKEDIS